MRRIGSNIRKHNLDDKKKRLGKSIIRYSDDQPAKNDYPKRIVSPTKPSRCCKDKNRAEVGKVREEDGFKYTYSVCKSCGYAVRYITPASSGASEEMKAYRRWNNYAAQ